MSKVRVLQMVVLFPVCLGFFIHLLIFSHWSFYNGGFLPGPLDGSLHVQFRYNKRNRCLFSRVKNKNNQKTSCSSQRTTRCVYNESIAQVQCFYRISTKALQVCVWTWMKLSWHF